MHKHHVRQLYLLVANVVKRMLFYVQASLYKNGVLYWCLEQNEKRWEVWGLKMCVDWGRWGLISLLR